MEGEDRPQVLVGGNQARAEWSRQDVGVGRAEPEEEEHGLRGGDRSTKKCRLGKGHFMALT